MHANMPAFRVGEIIPTRIPWTRRRGESMKNKTKIEMGRWAIGSIDRDISRSNGQ